ncbi:uncharacterized protein LOC109111702 isoform X4 [Cyprinus carpio]|uniref:Uncharacterized protein LOC109111702 isoform X4 n=1 Tax=Cyprinus carpio TaxID=7962 RepID=A0A9Q9XMJ9_CYPCA|nr:uncharacterized protein LOC109111702 isoform X4 [Cyprinus carpio]
MKTTAPGMSVKAFTAMLDQRTKWFGRTAGRAMCGESQWTAARETSKQANKLDEEGVEIAVCRHGFLLKGLNMSRGEIFAYPMFLQKEFQDAAFLSMDVTCCYVPYLEKVSEILTHLQPLQKIRHCLSVMHAKAHNTKCEILWNAGNQEGAGTTLGEEVEKLNSFLSRCALTTKYMSKSVRTDMLTVHAIGWNQRKENGLHIAFVFQIQKGNAAASSVDARGLQISIEALFVSICQKKHYLYRQNDRNKRRQKIPQKIAKEKKRLLDEIQRYNQQPDDGVDILAKKKLSDQLMLVLRLTEEKQILVKEMMQHCQYLKDSVAKVQTLIATISDCIKTGSKCKSNYMALCTLKFIGQTIFT